MATTVAVLQSPYEMLPVPEVGLSVVPFETYGNSLSTFRLLGHATINLALGNEKRQGIERLAYEDFTTALGEMITTDEEFSENLVINNIREHPVIDQQVCSADGRSMVTILEDGVESSKLAAIINPELEAQVDRDECDVEIAVKVNKLLPGQTLWGVSMEPTEELVKYHKTYSKLGYKKGLIYIQTYSMLADNKLVAGSFSVDSSDEEAWRDLLATKGMHIPEGESTNKWLKYAQVLNSSPEQAQALAFQLRDEYHQSRNLTRQRFSASEYIDENTETIKKFFDLYYHSLANAIETGNNNSVLQNFASAMLIKNIDDLDPDVRQQLIRISNSNKFSDESGITVDAIIRYAVVEELRKGFKPVKNNGHTALVEKPQYITITDQLINPAQIHRLIVNNVQIGVEAARSYGGCPGNIKLHKSSVESLLELEQDVPGVQNSPQESFGGNSCPEVKDGQHTTCPECKKKVRAIVPDRKTIFCSNTDCKLVAPGLAGKTKELTSASQFSLSALWQQVKAPKIPQIVKKTVPPHSIHSNDDILENAKQSEKLGLAV